MRGMIHLAGDGDIKELKGQNRVIPIDRYQNICTERYVQYLPIGMYENVCMISYSRVE